jgi:hypothetical protein
MTSRRHVIPYAHKTGIQGRIGFLSFVTRDGDAKRDRVYCAPALLDILEESARLKPSSQ